MMLSKIDKNKKSNEHNKDEGLIKKNELLDSLDLNIGIGALGKLKDVWARKKKVHLEEKEDKLGDIVKNVEGRVWTKEDFEKIDAV